MAGTAMLLAISTPDPDELESVQSYVTQVMPLLAAADGQSPRRMKVSKTIAGTEALNCFMMEFSSVEVIEKFLESEEYRALIPARDKGFKTMNIMIVEDM